MLIRMRTTIANPMFTAVAGRIVDLDNKQAERLISGGYATVVKNEKIKSPIIQPKTSKKGDDITDTGETGDKGKTKDKK